MTKPRAASSQPQLTPRQGAILWAADIDGLSPTEHYILLTLAKCVVTRNKDGPGWIAYPSLSQLADKSGIDRRTGSRCILVLIERGLVTRVAGNVRGDTTTYTLTGSTEARGIKPLGARMHQAHIPAPRGVLPHKSIESSSPVLDSNFKKGEGKPPTPSERKSGTPNRKPPVRKLWPAGQPAKAQRVLDQHAQMWTASVDRR